MIEQSYWFLQPTQNGSNSNANYVETGLSMYGQPSMRMTAISAIKRATSNAEARRTQLSAVPLLRSVGWLLIPSSHLHTLHCIALRHAALNVCLAFAAYSAVRERALSAGGNGVDRCMHAVRL